MPVPTGVVAFTPLAFEQVTVTSSAALIGSLLVGGIPTGTKHIIFWPEGDVRWRSDGSDPTTAIGIVMPGSQLTIFENQPALFVTMKVIASDDTFLNIQMCF